MTGPILGWDIGGANIKAARIRGHGDPAVDVIEQPFALWREPQQLPAILKDIAARLGTASTMAITMTAELADCFPTKRDGVRLVLDAVRTALPAAEAWVFGTDGRFSSVDAACDQPMRVAAANWLAAAMFVARTYPDVLFIDVGSTTTDIIPITRGVVAACGRTDTERLRNGELVYTGALRTPVAAMVQSVRFGGHACRIAAEHFAIAADVHLWLRHIDEHAYTCETPDGRGRSRRDAAARLARMVCADLEMLDDDEITDIAEWAYQKQVQQIAAAIRQVLRRGGPGPGMLLTAGAGCFLAQAAAARLRLPARDLVLDGAGTRAVPALAVARLLMETAETDRLHR
jgi:probable H4MPT-linked C1 transfer pathway protein